MLLASKTKVLQPSSDIEIKLILAMQGDDSRVKSESSFTRMATFVYYLRLPVLAVSGIASVASGLLYYKQKLVVVFLVESFEEANCPAANSSTRGISLLEQIQMKAYLVLPNSECPTGKKCGFPRPMAKYWEHFSFGRPTKAWPRMLR